MKLHHRIHAHIIKHRKRYLLGTGLAGAGFFAVKALIFAIGFFGVLNHGGTFANFDPSICSEVTDISSTQCEALVALYNSTDGDNWIDATNRGNTGTVCDTRYGISCTDNHVTIIDLDDNDLSGSADFSALTGLVELHLGNKLGNNLTSIDVSGLTNLTTLHVMHNHLASINLDGLTNLTDVDLGWNNLSTISLAGLTNLDALDLRLNQLSNIDLSDLSALTRLHLSDNQLSSIDISNSPNLDTLILYNNLLSKLPESTIGLTNLTTINLNNSCRDTGSMSTELVTFLDTKVGSSDRQISVNPSCPAPAFDCDYITDIPAEECTALVNFYNNTNGDNWSSNSGWLQTGAICNVWNGVSCTDGHVTEINLGGGNLSGAVPSLSALTELQHLYLTNNQITSIDLTELGNLRTLDLNYNQLSTIDLTDVINLQELFLGGNQLSFIDLAGLSNIRQLILVDNNLSSIDVSEISNLQYLDLDDNQLSSINISGLIYLEGITANGNQLSSIELTGLTRLVGLSLEDNLLTTLPESTMDFVDLSEGSVLLSGNCRNTGSMSTELLTFLNSKVGNSDRQIVINPSCSTPPEEPQASTGVCDQVTDISTGECLALIDFYNSTNGANRTTGTNRGTTGIVCRSGDTQEGRYGVDCSCNRFDVNCESTTGGTVKRLDLQGNNLSGSIPSSLTGLGALRWLSLGYNNITSLPDNIGDFTNLVGLSVYNNQISTLPASLYTMTQLTHLEINNNNIVNIAEDISNLTSLQNFHLGNNPLDHIPDNLWTMTGMRTLWLTNLGITELPEALWDFQYLTDLQLDENEISLLSGGIGKLTQLRYVYLNDNLLTSLPDEFFDLGNLQDLYLDHNTIEGTMDPFCRTGASAKGITHGNFERVRNFNISYNRFSGEIPQCLISADQLDSPVGNIFDLGQHRYNGDTNSLAYNYLDIDDLSSELTDYLDLHFLGKNNLARTRQYRSSNLSIAGTIISSREHPRLGDTITLAINYANDGPVKIISGRVYVDVVSGIVITGNSNVDYTTGMIGSAYGEAGDPCFDDLYTGGTGIYRNIFEILISGQQEGMTVMQRLQDTFGYTGTQVDAGKFFVDTLIEQGSQIFGDISFSDMMYAFAGIDLATIPNCGTAGRPVYVFDVGNIDIDGTGTILLSGFILPNFSGTTIENPTSISSTYDLRVDTNTGNNEKNISKILSTDKIVTLPSLPDLKYTNDAFEYRGYIVPGNKSIINDTQGSTLIGTSAIDFTNTSTLRIPIIITSPEENIQAYIASGTNTEFSGTACESVLLAPEEYPTSVASGVFGSGYVVKKVFKIGSSCTGSSVIFDQDVEIGIQLPTLKTGYVIKSSSDGDSWDEVPAGNNSANANGIVISFTTRHFSYFAIAEPIDGEIIVPPVTTHYGGGITVQKDDCPAGDFSPSFYDGVCGTKPTTTHNSADTCDGATDELIGAYDFAFAHQITTQPTCARAKLGNTIRRKEMAKMISVFAINIMGMTPNTGKNCSFTDLSHESGEMNVFAKLACQLGLMGYETDGVTQKDEFEPNVLVDRGQFGTILSRILRGTTYAGGKPYYVKHLAALKKANIMTKIDTPRVLELRGRVLLTMQRVFEMKK